MKSPEFVPRSDEIKEEDERLYKNDPGMNVKEGRASKYKDNKDIPDSDEDMEEKMADILDNKKDNENENESEEENFSKTELLKQQIENDIKKGEKIGFLQNSPDAAHIGPEFYEEGKDFEDNEKDSLYANMEDLEKQPTFLSKLEYLISRPFISKNKNKAKGKDNLKTLSDEEKERLSKKEIREVLHQSE
jgi:hypothetical protein